jgi:hypothetical protein
MKQWIIWVWGALSISLLIIVISNPTEPSKRELKSEVQLFYDLQDTIKYLRNKDSSNTAQIKLLEADKKTLSRVLSAKDKSLSDLLKKGSTAASVITTRTVYDTVTKVRVDTVNQKPYFLNITKNKWANIRIELKDDSLRKNFVFNDSISVAFKRVRQEGFLKGRKSVVEVTTHNPYVRVDGVRSFNITKNKNKNLFWAGLGLGVAGAILIK